MSVIGGSTIESSTPSINGIIKLFDELKHALPAFNCTQSVISNEVINTELNDIWILNRNNTNNYVMEMMSNMKIAFNKDIIEIHK